MAPQAARGSLRVTQTVRPSVGLCVAERGDRPPSNWAIRAGRSNYGTSKRTPLWERIAGALGLNASRSRTAYVRHLQRELAGYKPPQVADFSPGSPQLRAEVALENERHNSAHQVLVDAGEGERSDLVAGLFEHLADEALMDGFGQLEDASRRLPVAVVRAL